VDIQGEGQFLSENSYSLTFLDAWLTRSRLLLKKWPSSNHIHTSLKALLTYIIHHLIMFQHFEQQVTILYYVYQKWSETRQFGKQTF
jgi:hypothetical protein